MYVQFFFQKVYKMTYLGLKCNPDLRPCHTLENDVSSQLKTETIEGDGGSQHCKGEIHTALWCGRRAEKNVGSVNFATMR